MTGARKIHPRIRRFFNARTSNSPLKLTRCDPWCGRFAASSWRARMSALLARGAPRSLALNVSRRMRRRLLGVVILIVAAVVISHPLTTYVSEWLDVDACLDSGGSFNYSSMDCDHAANHPYISFERRHPGVLRTLRIRTGVCAPALELGLAMLVWPRRRTVG